VTVEMRAAAAARLKHQPPERKEQEVPRMTAGASARMPNVARIYDFLLGGKENNEEDRRAAEQLLEAVPDAAVAAWDNREFLGRAVRFLAAEAGIRQFLDIGTGLPTRGNVHSIAQQIVPDARVAYVDNDPVVVLHARALLRKQPNVLVIEGDLRDPGEILANPTLRTFINFDEPVGVLLVAVLHFLRDVDNPRDAVSKLKDAMAPGSFLVLSHVTGDDLPPEATKRARTLYEQATAPGTARTRREILRFFNGLNLVRPGLVNVASWRADWMEAEPGRTIFYAGVGVKTAGQGG